MLFSKEGYIMKILLKIDNVKDDYFDAYNPYI